MLYQLLPPPLLLLPQVNEAMDHVASGKARYRVVLTSDWPETRGEGQEGQQQ